MSIICITLILLSLSFCLALVFQKKTEEVIPVSVLGIIILLYLCGFTGNLKIGIYFCILAAFCSAGTVIYLLIKDKTQWKLLFTPGLVIFMIAAAGLGILHENRLFSYWDEFSHWGLVIKNMITFDKFGTVEEATTIFRDYPPASSLFSYFGCSFTKAFRESDAIYSQNIFLCALFLPMFKNLEWKKIGQVVCSACMMILLPSLFYTEVFFCIYVDILLGALFAYILYTYYTNGCEKKTLFMICQAFIVLPLIKASGLGLALIAGGIILCDILFFQKEWNRKQKVLWSVCMAVSVIFAKGSWELHLRWANVDKIWNTSRITLKNIWGLLNGGGQEYQHNTVQNFGNAFLKSEYCKEFLGIMPLLGWLILFVVLAVVFIYLFIPQKIFRKRYIVCISGTFIGFWIYWISLLFLYLFSFSAHEAERLASYERYLSTYVLGMFAFLLLMIQYFVSQRKETHYKAAWPVLCIGVLLLNYQKPAFLELSKELFSEDVNFVRQYSQISDEVLEQLDATKDEVYIVSQNDNGLYNLICGYNFTPVHSDTAAYNLGRTPEESDIYTKYISLEDFKEILKGYTHLYIHNKNEVFVEGYQSLFESAESIRNKTLYRIEVQDDTVFLKRN